MRGFALLAYEAGTALGMLQNMAQQRTTFSLAAATILEVLDVPDDAVLTQYGQSDGPGRNEFRCKPRFAKGETDLSMLWGELTVERATLLVTKRPVLANDAVRYTTARLLRGRGFQVQHTPSRRMREHISVTVPGGHIEWDNDQEMAFLMAFADYEGGAR
jgi:hypothetical protein